LLTTTSGCFIKSVKAVHFCRLSLFCWQGSPKNIIVVLL